ncbi:Outer membrane receptor proteins, mostly Fe transport [Catalinimonas alkaloidigena]|uniref:Outer membrane receptor proteins, mostly Fe transport n=1 Tax=Catalinimonas alkaloidigena TaxID=1075417 RepID=A0A1G9IJ71_9BACT|nr:TonB-dependent receptor [Catalinimonas alkaloidigena]SDL25301.1 Outer membrane receptor proteins, mostly Fe transport [Catalinimonas alkaloidigena]
MRFLIPFLFLTTFSAVCQSLTQTVRGRITDAETQAPLVGANVLLLDGNPEQPKGTVTDTEGYYRLEGVPVGRHAFRFTYLGYEEDVRQNVIVGSAKEVILNSSLREAITTMAEVEVKAAGVGEVQNEMATVSARAFTVDETERYAGSRGDPARMASNFAGVQGADDSRNDIVIRGNSPQGVLWQLEGVPIPNPNHFNIPGTAGGPVTILNNKVLANSDFFTGAFPAQYGNAIAGVFDLKFRNGNNEQHEFSGQLGVLGTELSAEGPLTKNHRSSYLATYRYSTLSLFQALGIDIGTTSVPRYQDLNFRVNFPLKKGGNLALFGLGGLSHVDILISDQKKPVRDLYGQNDRDQYFSSHMGTVGLTYSRPYGTRTFLKATVLTATEGVSAFHELVYRHVDANDNYQVDSLVPLLDYNFRQHKLSGGLLTYHKFGARSTLSVGANLDWYFFHFQDSLRNIVEGTPRYYQFRTRWDAQRSAVLAQPYVQWKYRFSDAWTLNAGVHAQYFSLSGSVSPFEPRLGVQWNLADGQALSLGLGRHSQMQSPYLYFYGQETVDGVPQLHNLKMDFTRSNHAVLSYNRALSRTMRLKAETYYQYLFDIPVTVRPSSFSLVNTGVGFSRFFPDTLQNTGIGRNYGVELTLEKAFSQGYFFLLTGSLFESTYRGSDGIWRDTDFNGNYAANALVTKEFSFKNNSTLQLGTKWTTAGGRRYGPVDLPASEREREVVYVDSLRNSWQIRPYFRVDLRISYRLNRPKVAHEFSLDLVNILDRQNVLNLTYAPNEFDPNASPIREEYQLGFLPLFYYRIDF